MSIIRWSLSILVIGSLLLALAPNSVLLVLCKLSIRCRTFGWEYRKGVSNLLSYRFLCDRVRCQSDDALFNDDMVSSALKG